MRMRIPLRDRFLHDRFMLFLVLATAVHAIVFFGVRFGIDLEGETRLADTLDVVLVQWRSEETPEEADYLAQADQVGGGETTEPSRPSAEVSAPIPVQEEGPDAASSEAANPEVRLESREVIAAETESPRTNEPVSVEQPDTEVPSAAELMHQSMELTSLEAEIRNERSWQSKLPRREFISANTRQYEFASYMNAWVSKVERVGNLNYPSELRRKKLYGDLVMTVAIRQNGTVESIDIKRSSGVTEIDQAAVGIVRLAAPYAPLPDNIADRVDVLHITRTWRFGTALGVGDR